MKNPEKISVIFQVIEIQTPYTKNKNNFFFLNCGFYEEKQ